MTMCKDLVKTVVPQAHQRGPSVDKSEPWGLDYSNRAPRRRLSHVRQDPFALLTSSAVRTSLVPPGLITLDGWLGS
jgi:hypothetical protein